MNHLGQVTTAHRPGQRLQKAIWPLSTDAESKPDPVNAAVFPDHRSCPCRRFVRPASPARARGPARCQPSHSATLGEGVEVGLDSGPGVLPVPGAQLVQVIDDQDGGTAGHRELGQHLVDNGLAVELGRRGRGFGAAGRGADGPGSASQNSCAPRWPGRTDRGRSGGPGPAGRPTRAAATSSRCRRAPR